MLPIRHRAGGAVDQRVKGLRGLDLAVSRPRWGTLLSVAAVGLAVILNARRLGNFGGFNSTTGAIALAAGLLSTALLVGITATKDGTNKDETWEAALLYAFGALFLALPQAVLAPLATYFMGGRYPTSDDEIMGATVAAGIQVTGLVAYCMVKGARLKPKARSYAEGGSSSEGRWD